jgi:hypothetical protein
MTDDQDNIVDIGGQLPPVEIRKPWRQRLPEYYVKRLDALKETHRDVGALRSALLEVRREFSETVEKSGGDRLFDNFEAERLEEDITAALVLLACAEEKLRNTLPIEEFMSPKDLAEYEKQR